MKRLKVLGLSGNAKQRRKIVRRFNAKNPFAIMKPDPIFGVGDYVIFQKDIGFGET